MTDLPFTRHIARETDAFVSSATGAFDRAVPTCPGWTVADLADHVWDAFSFWGQVVEKRLQDSRDAVEPPHPEVGSLLGELRDASERLIEALDRSDPLDEVWTWSDDQTVSFVARRMAHEASVHRYDCQIASGPGDPVEAAMAADGIDEFIEYFWGRDESWDRAGARIDFVSPEGRWTLMAGDETEDVDATVEGSSSDLFLGLWRRVPLEQLDIEGDGELAEHVFAWSDLT